jgi:exosortase
LVVIAFYALPSAFGQNGDISAAQWVWNACNRETDYLHGRFVPLAIVLLLFYHRDRIAAAPVRPHIAGMVGVVFGLLLFVLAFRALQPRLAIGALPFIILGGVTYLWGFKAARAMAFPVCLIFFAIPLPNLLQATAKLQIVATQTAYHLSSLLGASVTASGNMIQSTSGEGWGFDIAEGCSGIRSLVALSLIAAVYAHLTQDRTWKKVLIFALSIPIALVANGLRVTTIVMIAEHFDPEFAARAYHTYSGLLFIPIGIAGIVLADVLINRRLPFYTKKLDRRTAVQRSVSP